MNVLFFSPGYPSEMTYFARALARSGAKVIGLGDQPAGALSEIVRPYLTHHLSVSDLWNEGAVIAEVCSFASRVPIDRVECLWEPGMLLAARLRESLGLPGLTVAQTVPFRDKEEMKRALDAAGVRTPRHARARTVSEVREAAERIGFPLVVKPIAGAGSADTHVASGQEELERVLLLTQHVPEVSVEEFIEGEEFTFDTICAGGQIAFRNMSWYRPKPLIARTVEWISPQTVTLRDLSRPDLAVGHALGEQVIKALGYTSGFTHMEWFRTPSGEAVFGEIGARPPGARTVDTMNFCLDGDVFTGWAEAVTRGRIEQSFERRFNVAIVFKRALGRGRIQRIEGLEPLLAALGPQCVSVELLPVGAHRRDWKQTLLSDGHLVVRHPELDACCLLADRVGTDLQIYAA